MAFAFITDNTRIIASSFLYGEVVGLVCWFVGFYGISTFVGYLTPKSILCNLFYWKTVQF